VYVQGRITTAEAQERPDPELDCWRQNGQHASFQSSLLSCVVTALHDLRLSPVQPRTHQLLSPRYPLVSANQLKTIFMSDTVFSIPIPGGLSLRPVKNRGRDIFECLSIYFIVLILYFVLQWFIYFTVSFVSRAIQIYS